MQPIYYIKIYFLSKNISQKYSKREDSTSAPISTSTANNCCVVSILLKFNLFKIETYSDNLVTKLPVISIHFQFFNEKTFFDEFLVIFRGATRNDPQHTIKNAAPSINETQQHNVTQCGQLLHANATFKPAIMSVIRLSVVAPFY